MNAEQIQRMLAKVKESNKKKQETQTLIKAIKKGQPKQHKYFTIPDIEGETWEKENKGFGYFSHSQNKWVEGDYYVSNKNRRKLKFIEETKTEIRHREKLSNSGMVIPTTYSNNENNLVGDKEFLTQKLHFYRNKKRKREIDRKIETLIENILKGNVNDLSTYYATHINKNTDDVELHTAEEVYYLCKVYDTYLTNKYSKEIMEEVNKTKSKQ